MSDQTSALPSLTSRAVDASGRWTKVWAPWIKKLLDTVRVTAQAVETISVTVDQVNGAYTINRNVNGRIVGQVKLDGTDASTNFAVLADKFIIVHPSANATEIQAFITGLVDNVATIGINGNLIVDGTIAARCIAVDELSALTANIGTVTAGVIQSTSGNMTIDLDNGTIVITS